jgi:hypothetical protein
LTQFSDINPKQLFIFEIDRKFMEFIFEKKTINGIKYNVFEEKYGKKFEN